MRELIALGGADGEVHGTVTLDYAARQKSRQRITLDNGEAAAIVLRHGERPESDRILQTRDGTYRIRVIAAAEAVTTVSAGDAVSLARASYHLGNRHVAIQIDANWIRYETDHVIDDMVRGFGLHLVHETAPFEPEQGAYARHAHTAEAGEHNHANDNGAHQRSHAHGHEG
jgi:urease accessory protein